MLFAIVYEHDNIFPNYYHGLKVNVSREIYGTLYL